MDVQVPTKSLASLPIIDFEAIANKDVTEIQKLVQAGRTQGMFYLNLQGPRTNAVFDDIPTLSVKDLSTTRCVSPARTTN